MTKMCIALLAAAFAAPLLAQVPEIAYDSTPNPLKLPEHIHLGEAAGVATTSKGSILVYTRTGDVATLGASRTFTHGGSRLFEFDSGGRYVREIGQGVYGFLFGEAVRVDPQDNIWIVDRGSNMVIKFDAAGRVLMTLSRKPESVNLAGPFKAGGRPVAGDNFVQPTDVAWDAAGNIFVADSGNARIVKLDKNGKYLKSWGSKGTEPAKFESPHSLAVDAKGNVYVADPGNNRVEVFDSEGTPQRAFDNVGAPRALCISPGPHQYLYVSNSNSPDSMDNGEIYKMELDGKILGRFGRAGKQLKEFGTVNEMDCRTGSLYVSELTNWRVQKLTLH